jgi:hypothetical protein
MCTKKMARMCFTVWYDFASIPGADVQKGIDIVSQETEGKQEVKHALTSSFRMIQIAWKELLPQFVVETMICMVEL